MNKVHARGKRSKQSARRAPKLGTTATDRRLLAQAERETAEGKAAQAPVGVRRTVISANQVVMTKREFESIRDQLCKLETEVIGVWACRNDEADGLERILVPLYAARRNFEVAVAIEMDCVEVQS